MLALFLLGSCTRGAAQRQVFVTLDSASRSLEIGQTATARAQVRDQAGNAVRDSVTWLSDNPSIARVDAQGKITAAAPGVTGITARVGSSLATTRVSVFTPAPQDSVARNDVQFSTTYAVAPGDYCVPAAFQFAARQIFAALAHRDSRLRHARPQVQMARRWRP